MMKPNFGSMWQWAIKAGIALVLDLAVAFFGKLQAKCAYVPVDIPCGLLVAVGSILLFLVLLLLVQLSWRGIFRIARVIQQSKQAAKPSTLFAECLDGTLRELEQNGFTPSGLGRSFIERAKETPPFLGLNHLQAEPLLSADDERRLEEFFAAKTLKEQTYGSIIRGGVSRRRGSGESLEAVAKEVYGDEGIPS